jgi:hypothetical protein
MSGPGKLWRSRWAAVGAAVAVTLGAGGLATTFADSAPSSLVAISPVRVLDTRLAAMGPALSSATPRLLDVTGAIPTVGADGSTITSATVVPDGATAIVANVTIVGPTTAGFVSVRPGTASGSPTTSSLNATASGVIVPNAVTVELPTTGATAGQIQLWFQGTATGATSHLLVDIVGYYTAGAGPPGATGPRGFSAWDTIPSGVTVTGEASIDTFWSGRTEIPDGFSVMLPGRAPAALGQNSINFDDAIGVAVDGDPACTGSNLNPTAPPGKLCIYEYGLRGITSLRGDALPYQNDRGFFITYFADDQFEGDVYMFLVWAYTAP